MLKGRTLPFSGEMVAFREAMASSLSLESKMPSGRETSAYLVDMVLNRTRASYPYVSVCWRVRRFIDAMMIAQKL